MPREPYSLSRAEQAHCPRCHARGLDMLGRDGPGPMFYICWLCQWVSQIGLGPVTRSTPQPESEFPIRDKETG